MWQVGIQRFAMFKYSHIVSGVDSSSKYDDDDIFRLKDTRMLLIWNQIIGSFRFPAGRKPSLKLKNSPW